MSTIKGIRIPKIKRGFEAIIKRALTSNRGPKPASSTSTSTSTSTAANKTAINTTPTESKTRPRILNEKEAQKLRIAAQNPAPPKKPLKPIDIKQTKRYKTLYRRWVSTIVAIPILFYTTWELYERTYGTKSQKHLIEKKPQEQAPVQNTGSIAGKQD